MKTSLLILSLILSSFVYSQTCPAVASYPFDGTAEDYSGNEYDGELVNDADVSSGFIEIGYTAEDYMQIPNDVLDGIEDFTISFDFRINSFNLSGLSPTNTFIAGGSSTEEGEFAISYQKADDAFVIALKGTGKFFAADINEETWYCLTVKRDGALVSVYLDGEEIGTETFSVSPLNIVLLEIGQEIDCASGCFVENQCLNGSIEDLTIYDCAVETESCEPYALLCDTTLYYKFNNEIEDYSGNEFDGSLNADANVTSNYLEIGYNDDDYASIPVDAMHALNDFSISFNFRLNDFNVSGTFPTNTFVAGMNDDEEAEFALSYEKLSDGFEIAINDVGGVIPADIDPGQWYCYTVYREGTTVWAELDGVTLATTLTFPADPLNIEFLEIGQEIDCMSGCFVENQSLNGAMDNLFISECTEEVSCSEFPVNIESEINSINTLHVYPNPVKDYLYFAVENIVNGNFQIINMHNEIMLEKDITDIATTIDVKDLSSGVYFLIVKNNTETLVGKFVKE